MAVNGALDALRRSMGAARNADRKECDQTSDSLLDASRLLLRRSRERIELARDAVAAARVRVHDARNAIQRAMIVRERRLMRRRGS
jgi:hypothetical protein